MRDDRLGRFTHNNRTIVQSIITKPVRARAWILLSDAFNVCFGDDTWWRADITNSYAVESLERLERSTCVLHALWCIKCVDRRNSRIDSKKIRVWIIAWDIPTFDVLFLPRKRKYLTWKISAAARTSGIFIGTSFKCTWSYRDRIS